MGAQGRGDPHLVADRRHGGRLCADLVAGSARRSATRPGRCQLGAGAAGGQAGGGAGGGAGGAGGGGRVPPGGGWACRSRGTTLHPFGLSLSKPSRVALLTVRVEIVEIEECSHALLIWLHACVEGGGRDSPRRARYLFFASPKKSTQKKGAPQSATPSLCEGANLRRGGCGVRRGTRFAAAQRRSDNHGESVHEACALRRACQPRNRPAAGAASRGRTATLAIASLGLAVAARSARVCSDCYRPRAAGAIEKSNHYVEEPLTRAPPVIDLNLSSCALL